MKSKKISILIALVLIITSVFTGCFNLSTKETSEEISVPEIKKEDGVFAILETAVFDTFKITATEIAETKGNSIFVPEEGNIFVGVNFTVENTSDDNIAVSSLIQFDAYADDVKCEYSIGASSAFDGGTLDGDVAPGKKLVGWYAIEVPESWNEIEIQYTNGFYSNASKASFVFNK